MNQDVDVVAIVRRCVSYLARALPPPVREDIIGDVHLGLIVNPLKGVDERGPAKFIFGRCMWTTALYRKRFAIDEQRREHLADNVYDFALVHRSDEEPDNVKIEAIRKALHKMSAADVDLLFTLLVADEGVVAAGKRLGVHASNVSRKKTALVNNLRRAAARTEAA